MIVFVLLLLFPNCAEFDILMNGLERAYQKGKLLGTHLYLNPFFSLVYISLTSVLFSVIKTNVNMPKLIAPCSLSILES